MRARCLPVLLSLLLGLLAVPRLPHAEEREALREPRFDTLKQLAGSSASVVAALAQDRQGFLWMGTGAGLMRYDGYAFQVQRSSDGKSLGFVRVLLAGRDGRVWIGTESNGLAVYDPASETITVPKRSGERAATIRALAEDRDGAIWIATLGGGLERYDPPSGRFTQLRRDPSRPEGLPEDRIQALKVDSQGTLWVGSWAGLHRRRAGRESFEPVGLAGRSVIALHEAADGRLWAGTQQGDVVFVDPAGGTAQPAPEMGVERGPVTSFVDVPAVDGQAPQVWVARVGGIEARAPGGALLHLLRNDPRNPGSLASNQVRTMMSDRAGWIWLATYGGVVQRHDPANRAVWVRGPSEGHGGVLREPSLRSIAQLGGGEIWIGTSERGVAVLDSSLQLVGAVELARGLAPIGRVDAIAQTRDGTVWLGSEKGLHHADAVQRRVLATEAIGSGGVRRLLALRDGRLLVGTRAGVLVVPAGGGAAAPVLDDAGAALRGDVNALVEAADGGVWVGGESGLFFLPPGGRPLRRVEARAGQEPTQTSVVGLLLDRSGRLWVDTSLGLHRLRDFDGRHAGFERISERLGIGESAFGANLLEDAEGRIWTQRHVYDPKREQVYELTAADGVDFGSAWFRAYTALADGRMLFGGSSGLLVISPAQFRGWRYEPPVVVSELRVDGRVRRGWSQPLQLAAGQRSFSVEFAALDFSDPARNHYAYRLEGFDADWQEVGAGSRHASYSNLSPGSYRLKVRGSNRAGAWSSQELDLAVEVLPAWWQTWWARALAVGLVALALWSVVQLRTRVLQRRQQVLEAEVGRRTAELEALSQSLRQKTVELEASSLTDPLTGLRNRRFLTQHIDDDVRLVQRRVEEARQLGAPPPQDADLIFFLLDIDHFKQINDRFGHAGGDAVLQQMRERLAPVFRDADYLVRWGGEEFLIVARGSSRDHAPELAERARAFVAERPFKLDSGAEIALSCSVGFACFPLRPREPRAIDWSATLGLADRALYAVKRAGRNGWLGVLELDAGTDAAAALRAAQAALETGAKVMPEGSALRIARSASMAQ